MGFVGPYGCYDDSYPYYAYPDDACYEAGYGETSCALVRRRVLTRYGWRVRTVQVCE